MPIVIDSEMLRAYAQTIKLKEAEIERLKAELLRARMFIDEKDAEIERMPEQAIHFRDLAREHAVLLLRAADALEDKAFNRLNEKDWALIAELRKAATE